MEELKEKDMIPKLVGEPWLKYPTERSKCRHSYGIFECQYCGKEFEAQISRIKSRNTKSCGCLKGQNHNLSQHKFYNTAISMINRCTNPKDTHYEYYGARGITVCDEWLNIATFIAWCEATHPNIEGLSLDRIDNDRGYSPENCRWANNTTQWVNKRMQKNNTSGFVGVKLRGTKWTSVVKVQGKEQWIGIYETIEEAVQARDQYIIDNKLPNKLSTEYAKETK